jgi:predicted SPOUT superfamily RNA methylase MTH1
MVKKPIKVIKESTTGRNQRFLDPNKSLEMTRTQFVKQIEKGNYAGYHVRKVNQLKTPVSNPDNTKRNNLD